MKLARAIKKGLIGLAALGCLYAPVKAQEMRIEKEKSEKYSTSQEYSNENSIIKVMGRQENDSTRYAGAGYVNKANKLFSEIGVGYNVGFDKDLNSKSEEIAAKVKIGSEKNNLSASAMAYKDNFRKESEFSRRAVALRTSNKVNDASLDAIGMLGFMNWSHTGETYAHITKDASKYLAAVLLYNSDKDKAMIAGRVIGGSGDNKTDFGHAVYKDKDEDMSYQVDLEGRKNIDGLFKVDAELRFGESTRRTFDYETEYPQTGHKEMQDRGSKSINKRINFELGPVVGRDEGFNVGVKVNGSKRTYQHSSFITDYDYNSKSNDLDKQIGARLQISYAEDNGLLDKIAREEAKNSYIDSYDPFSGYVGDSMNEKLKRLNAGERLRLNALLTRGTGIDKTNYNGENRIDREENEDRLHLDALMAVDKFFAQYHCNFSNSTERFKVEYGLDDFKRYSEDHGLTLGFFLDKLLVEATVSKSHADRDSYNSADGKYKQIFDTMRYGLKLHYGGK